MRKARAAAWVATLLGLAVLCVPEASDACAVCFSARDENRQAFTITTAFMTALPLVMIGSVVFWLRARIRRHERDAAAPRHSELYH